MKKRTILPFALLLAVASLVVSCLDNDSTEYTYTDDTAITAFSVGTLNVYGHATSSKGEDSIYKTTVDCSAYPFYIDQTTHTIYNVDSLPYGTDPKKVLCTISTKNSGTVVIKSMTSDSLGYYSSTDSVDFSQPRVFQVFSNSAQVSRQYTVHVNVHQEQADSFGWTAMTDPSFLPSLESLRAVCFDGRLYVFGKKSGATALYSSADGHAWQDLTAAIGHSLSADAYLGVVAGEDAMYLWDTTTGSVLSTTDGSTWTTTATSADIARLVAVSPAGLYAYANGGGILVSTDGGATWQASDLDSDATLLPTEDLSTVTVALNTNKQAWRVMLIGNRDYTAYPTDKSAYIWSKIDETADYSQQQPWTWHTVDTLVTWSAPRMHYMQAFAYDGALYATGGASIDGRVTNMKSFYRSNDGGISWEKDTLLYLPDAVSILVPEHYGIAVDKNNYLWFVDAGAGHVWRGRIARLGWRKEQTAYTE